MFGSFKPERCELADSVSVFWYPLRLTSQKPSKVISVGKGLGMHHPKGEETQYTPPPTVCDSVMQSKILILRFKKK